MPPSADPRKFQGVADRRSARGAARNPGGALHVHHRPRWAKGDHEARDRDPRRVPVGGHRVLRPDHAGHILSGNVRTRIPAERLRRGRRSPSRCCRSSTPSPKTPLHRAEVVHRGEPRAGRLPVADGPLRRSSAATPGVYSAVITGIGRAFGETMIVLMATGNAALLSIDPFVPVRTMSATIGAEMAEVVFGDTHYNILFLIGAVLFIFTRAQRLRRARGAQAAAEEVRGRNEDARDTVVVGARPRPQSSPRSPSSPWWSSSWATSWRGAPPPLVKFLTGADGRNDRRRNFPRHIRDVPAGDHRVDRRHPGGNHRRSTSRIMPASIHASPASSASL